MKRNTLSHREFLRVGALVTGAVALAACVPAAAPVAPSAAGGGEAAAPAVEAIRLNVLAENWKSTTI